MTPHNPTPFLPVSSEGREGGGRERVRERGREKGERGKEGGRKEEERKWGEGVEQEE